MTKSPDAFRTISEVADWLGVQAHVLRFWESKFTQVKPVKRAGGRRYYRPADMLLLGGIRKLLHDDGLTIKGVQKILREQGMAYVADMSEPLDDGTVGAIDTSTRATQTAPKAAPPPEPEPPVAEVVSFHPGAAEPEPVLEPAPESAPEPEPIAEATGPEASEDAEPTPDSDMDITAEAADMEEISPTPPETEQTVDDASAPSTSRAAESAAEPEKAPDANAASGPTWDDLSVEDATDAASPAEHVAASDAATEDAPVAAETRATDAPEEAPPAPAPEAAPEEAPEEAPTADAAALPAFLHRPATPPVDTAHASAADSAAPEPADAARKPRIIDAPDPADEADIAVDAGPMAALSRLKRVSAAQAAEMRPLLAQLTALRDQMAGVRKDSPKE